MRRRRGATAVMLILVFILVLGGCGNGDEAPSTTAVTVAPTTTLVQGDPQGIACLNLSTQGLRLLNDFRQASRGIVAPDPEPYRQRADELRAEHARLGCPGDLLRGFPDG